MHSTRHLLFALSSTALLGVTLGACFTGSQAEGLPCTANSHCGPTLECIDGFCGGVVVCGDGSTVEAVLACNGTPDCEDGYDEDSEICGTDAFFCNDDSTVPLEVTCDGTPDCPDGEDEAAAICVFDQCTEPHELFEFYEGPRGDGIDDPLGLFVGNFIGDTNSDLVFAGRNGTFVRVMEFQPGMPPTITELPGDNDNNDPAPNFLSPIQDVYPYDFETDGDMDLLVLTSNGRFFGYASNPPDAPVPLPTMEGTSNYFEIPGSPTVIDVGLGKLDDDGFVDIVAVTDEGFVVTAMGDPVAGANGENPFQLALDTLQIDGNAFTQVLLANVYGDSIAELLVIGFTDGGPQLWILERQAGAVTDSWEIANEQPVPVAATEFAVGELDAGMGLDIAFIERMQGRVVILGQVAPGVFMPSGPALQLGVDINGLAARDIDCDGNDDLIFNVESPAAIQVLFTNDMAEISAARSLTIESAGKPQGNLALMKFDPDGSWDMFHAVSQTGQLAGPELRSFVSVDPSGDAP